MAQTTPGSAVPWRCGGPGTETYVPTLLIYKRAFVSGEVGSAAAIATILTALVLLVSVGIRRLEEAPDA